MGRPAITTNALGVVGRTRHLRAMGLWSAVTATALGCLGVVAIVAYEWTTYLPGIAAGEPAYFVRRCLFSVATLVGLPILPLLLVGAFMLCLPSRREHTEQKSVLSSSPEQPIATPSGHDAPYA